MHNSDVTRLFESQGPIPQPHQAPHSMVQSTITDFGEDDQDMNESFVSTVDPKKFSAGFDSPQPTPSHQLGFGSVIVGHSDALHWK